MKNLLLALCFAALSPFAVAVDISVGGTMLSIPVPDGFSVVTAEMKPYVEFSRHMVPPSNEQFVQFLSAADAALAAKGKNAGTRTQVLCSNFQGVDPGVRCKRRLCPADADDQVPEPGNIQENRSPNSRTAPGGQQEYSGGLRGSIPASP